MNKKVLSLFSEIKKLYKKSPREFARWSPEGHIKKVTENIELISEREGGNKDLLIAAAYIHDIGDILLERDDPKREEYEKELSINLLKKHKFSEAEIHIILAEIIAPHSCKEQNPETLDGKIFATADAMAHFKSDLYFYICWHHFKKKSFSEFKHWLKEKIERDYQQKIQFPHWRKKMKPYY